MAKKNLPIYRMLIDESQDSDLEVNYVSLVEDPAIQRDFMAFSEQKPFKFETDEARRIVTGPAMLANIPIYRRDKKGNEFYVVFDADTIEKIAVKFFQKGYQRNINLMHEQDTDVEGGVIFESWIVDSERGILPMKGYEDAENGSWFVSMKIENEEVWDQVMKGEFKGFSVEGIFTMKSIDETEEEMMRELESLAGKTVADEIRNLLKNL